MVCAMCGVRFSPERVDSVSHRGEAWCSEACAGSAFADSKGNSRLTLAVVDALRGTLAGIPLDYPFVGRELAMANMVLAILTIQTGRERAEGPAPTAQTLYRAAANWMADRGLSADGTCRYSLEPRTLAQLLVGMSVFQTARA